MSTFDELSPETRDRLMREAPGAVIRVPRRETRIQLEARRVRIRDRHRSQLEGGMTVRQSVRALMWSFGIGRTQVFEVLRK